MKKWLLLFVASIFSTATLASVTSDSRSADTRPRRQIAVTFDDLPASYGGLETMTAVTTKLLQSIEANRVPAIGFVNEAKLYTAGEIDARTNLLKRWVDAGLELGNHTFSHVYIDQVPFPAYREEVIRGETMSRMLLGEKGMRLRYFRHTQLRTGPTPEYKKTLDEFLANRGYTVAPVTIDNNEFIFAYIYNRAKARGDKQTMARVADAYVPYMDGVFAFFEKLSRDVLGYEVKQVLLLHANELNADYFDRLAEMMKRRGYEFISLEEALKDRAYSLPEAQSRRGLSWLHRWALAKGMKMTPEPREPEFITALFNAERGRDTAR